VPDWSGRGGTGVVSGSPTYSADVPVGPWFGRDVPRPYVVAAAGDTYARLIGGDLLHSNLIGQRLVA
jgi:hypothetical protein